MEFFTSKYTKQLSREPNNISSKLFICKQPCLSSKDRLIVPRHLETRQNNTKSSSQLTDSDTFTRRSTSPSVYSDKINVKPSEHLTPGILVKPVRLKRIKITAKVEQKTAPKQRRKFNSYSKNPDSIDPSSYSTKRRRHLSTDHRHKNPEEGKLENLKEYLKVFHKKSKKLLNELKKNVFGK